MTAAPACGYCEPMRQTTGFARLPDGKRVAFAVVGNGPAVVLPAWWVSNLVEDWHFDLSLALRDVRQLSELLLATNEWTVAGLRPYGQQRAERLRRMRRVSRTYAALMTTFTTDGRARRNRFYAASRARMDDVKMALGAIRLGPDRLPGEAFTDQLHESVLA